MRSEQVTTDASEVTPSGERQEESSRSMVGMGQQPFLGLESVAYQSPAGFVTSTNFSEKNLQHPRS